jgi:predicted membrane-bound mannosyltransferase
MRGKLLFVKYFPFVPGGNYIDNGISVAHYFNDTIAELEPLSPEARLKLEGEYTFPEHWTLTRLDRDVTTHEEARAVADRIPPSPFAK